MTKYSASSNLHNAMLVKRLARRGEATSTTVQRMALHELRQIREKSQIEVARNLRVGQPAVAKMEQRADMYVSNLRRYVEALGGQLEITARFADASVTITNFSESSVSCERQGHGSNGDIVIRVLS